MKRRNLLIGGLAAPALTVAPAWAQSGWPNKPIKIVHGFTAGGPVDVLARLLAAQFQERVGQPAVVEGRPGAGGTVGANYVAKAPADGYTLFLMASGHSAAPGLYTSLHYDPVNDFTMISMVARSPFAIMAYPEAPFKTVQEMVTQAKAQPGKLDYGSGGQGSGMHLAAVLMQARGGFQLTHVPYRGGNAPALAVMTGEVPMIFTSLAGMATHIESGKVRPLAVTSARRFATFPDIPTVAETVIPGFDVSAWYALAAPKGLPADVVARLNDLVVSSLARPDVSRSVGLQAAEIWTTSPQEAQAFLAQDVARWTQVIRDEKVVITN